MPSVRSEIAAATHKIAHAIAIGMSTMRTIAIAPFPSSEAVCEKAGRIPQKKYTTDARQQAAETKLKIFAHFFMSAL